MTQSSNNVSGYSDANSDYPYNHCIKNIRRINDATYISSTTGNFEGVKQAFGAVIGLCIEQLDKGDCFNVF